MVEKVFAEWFLWNVLRLSLTHFSQKIEWKNTLVIFKFDLGGRLEEGTSIRVPRI